MFGLLLAIEPATIDETLSDDAWIMDMREELNWVFVLAALLLKQISMFVMLDTIFQHVLDDVLDDVSTCPFCSCVTFLHGCGLKKSMCGISLPCLYGLGLF